MSFLSNALAELLTGKTPEAMYDALFAGRYLSDRGRESPAALLLLIKEHLRSAQKRGYLAHNVVNGLSALLVAHGFLNEAGGQLASHYVDVADG